MQVILWGREAACACDHILDKKNNLENVLTLISSYLLSNFRLCQIRPIFIPFTFWSTLKNACKYVKLALKYQLSNGEFFLTPFK